MQCLADVLIRRIGRLAGAEEQEQEETEINGRREESSLVDVE